MRDTWAGIAIDDEGSHEPSRFRLKGKNERGEQTAEVYVRGLSTNAGQGGMHGAHITFASEHQQSFFCVWRLRPVLMLDVCEPGLEYVAVCMYCSTVPTAVRYPGARSPC